MTIFKVYKILSLEQPDCIITHGNRAASIAQYANFSNTPIISLCHNYSFDRLRRSSAIIAVSPHLCEAVKNIGHKNVYYIPNMIALEDDMQFTHPVFRNPPIIGAIGRFVKKKGIDILLQALYLLKQRSIAFHAIIGGEGDEQQNLKELACKLNLNEVVQFMGWVEDKQKFYEDIDIFCLPSLHEPFGIVILEAFKYSKPVISTETEDPSSIITDEVNGLFAKTQDAESLAAQIERLINDYTLSYHIAQMGFQHVKTTYNLQVVAKEVSTLVHKYCHKNF